MAYDLLIKNGRIVDGTGKPVYTADVGVTDGRIVEIGALDGDAKRVIDAAGHVVAPGFIDNHCHFDGQVTFDPLCTFSCYNGVTTVINGNCSLTLAPMRPGDEHHIAQMLAKVEAIPLDVLENGVKWGWETFAEYLDVVDQSLGINFGALVGHSAIRRYVMGGDSQEREATGEEIEAMQGLLRDSMEAGALGISFDRNPRHVDFTGKLLPANVASNQEIISLAGELKALGRGAIEIGDPTNLELTEGFVARVAEASGGTVLYTSITQSVLEPDKWRQHLAHAAANHRRGNQAYPLINPRPGLRFFQMDSAEFFNFMPTWKSVMASPSEERLEAFSDPAIREVLEREVGEGTMTTALGFSGRWDLVEVIKPTLEKNASLKGKTVTEIAEEQGKTPQDAFLDLAVEEGLKTWFARNQQNNDDDAMAEILNSPDTVIGLSDSGAHIVREGGYGLSVHFLSHWVRDKQIMSLEEGVRRITSRQAAIFGLEDRGRLEPGLAADIVVFDADELGLEESEEAYDMPGGSMRLKQVGRGIPYTIVNGQVLIENGEHTGALPGRVLRGGNGGP
jgi:N-acyl-D-aspartate/D-glutamate deacylase